MRRILIAAAAGLLASAASAQDLKIALIHGKTGPLEAYAKQTETGLRMGFEYATKGTMAIDGRKIVIISKDDQGKPDVAKTCSLKPTRTTRSTSRSARRRHLPRLRCCPSPKSARRS